MNRIYAYSYFVFDVCPITLHKIQHLPLILLLDSGRRSFNGTQATRHMGGLDVFTDSIHANLNNPCQLWFFKTSLHIP